MNVLTPLLLLAGADLFGSAQAFELTYAGRLSPIAVSDPNAAEKGFSVTWLLTSRNRDEGFFITAEESAALPWPARFGFGAAEGSEIGPKIGYRFEEKDYVVELPGAVPKHAEALAAGGEIVDGALKYSPAGEKTIDGRDCGLVTVSTNFGEERTIAVEKATGLLVRYEQMVTLGRGDRFRLTLDLTEATPLDATGAAARQAIVEPFRLIAEAVGPEDRDSPSDLPAEVRAKIEPIASSLVASAANTSFGTLATAIARDLGDQAVRAEGVDGLVKKIVGSPAPPLDLKGLDGKPITADSLRDKVVVLHFWEYDNDSLAAPYGQVGYLDFLHRKRGRLGVAVIGVAENPAFAEPESRGRAVRSAKNLAAFMNLGYPIAIDDGTLLRAFGDPRSIAARLPLWVVIGPDGVVRSYEPGLYELEPNEGLKELDAAVVNLLREAREKQP